MFMTIIALKGLINISPSEYLAHVISSNDSNYNEKEALHTYYFSNAVLWYVDYFNIIIMYTCVPPKEEAQDPNTQYNNLREEF